MSKIPFEIKYREKIESGEYKVETRDGRPARVICWDRKGGLPLVVLVPTKNGDEYSYDYTSDGSYHLGKRKSEFDLFIVTPKEELTEFEEKVKQLIGNYPVTTRENKGSLIYEVRKAAAELLAIAKKQLNIENLKERAVELTKHINESGLEENSIEYNLIEFMCNLMDCPNWSEIVETAGLYAGRIKAEALKDLPRWYESRGVYSDGWINDGFLYYKNHSIQLSSLEKLPGFKES